MVFSRIGFGLLMLFFFSCFAAFATDDKLSRALEFFAVVLLPVSLAFLFFGLIR